MQGGASRLMVEVAVRQALKDGRDKASRRELRRLVEHGGRWSTGTFQMRFFALVQDMLRRDDHPYYAFINQLIRRVDEKYILGFGIDLGYESWTVGAHRIREREAQSGCNVPWVLMLEMSRETGERMAEGLADSLIQQGCAQGIHMYLLVDALLDAPAMKALCEQHPDCAFCALTPDSTLTEEALAALEGADNLLLLPTADLGTPFRSAKLLRERKRIYSLCAVYHDGADAAKIVSGEALAVPGEADCLLPCFLPAPDCPEETVRQVGEALLLRKKQPTTPQLPIDLAKDPESVDEIISTDACSMAVNLDGTYLAGNRLLPGALHPADGTLRAPETTLETAIERLLKKE